MYTFQLSYRLPIIKLGGIYSSQMIYIVVESVDFAFATIEMRTSAKCVNLSPEFWAFIQIQNFGE